MERTAPLHFDGWTLDLSSGELVRGDVRVRLQHQPQQILEALLARPGEVVTRAELTARLWPRAVVEFDMALNSAVRRLRCALRDDPEQPRYIETVPRRGYRYVGPLPQPSEPPAAPSAATGPAQEMPPEMLPDPVAGPGARSRTPLAARRHGWLGFALIALFGLGVTAWRGDSVTKWPESPGAEAAAVASGSLDGVARERYVLARHLLKRRGPGDAEAAMQRFSEVVAIEPGFALAWSGLASACWIETVEGRLHPEEGLSRVRRAAERALALDPQLAEAHLRLAHYHRRNGDRRQADEHVRRALAAEPHHPLALMLASDLARQAGGLEESVALLRRAVQADPLSAAARINLAWLLFRAGEVEHARAEAASLLELYPGDASAASILCLSLAASGRHADALAVDRRVPSADPARAQCRALALAGLGQARDAQAALAGLVISGDEEAALQVAEYFAQTGEFDRAFAWLDKAVQRDPGRTGAWKIRESPLLGPLRADPRWETLPLGPAVSRT